MFCVPVKASSLLPRYVCFCGTLCAVAYCSCSLPSFKERTAYNHFQQRMGETCGFDRIDEDKNMLLAHTVCAAHKLQLIVETACKLPDVRASTFSSTLGSLFVLSSMISACCCLRDQTV